MPVKIHICRHIYIYCRERYVHIFIALYMHINFQKHIYQYVDVYKNSGFILKCILMFLSFYLSIHLNIYISIYMYM